MQNWTDFFGITFVINLPTRDDRRMDVIMEMKRFSIPFTLFMAEEYGDGKRGVYESLCSIFKHCIRHKIKSALVFEDDVRFLVDPNEHMQKCIDDLPEDWDMLFLGVNIPHPENAKPYTENLLSINRGLALHSVVYSLNAMQKILDMPEPFTPIDLQIANRLQSVLKCFCTYPMLCTQRPGFSDIEGTTVDYSVYLENRFEKVKNFHKL